MGREFDILVVGGGHAGIEAALAAARLGARTGLLTLRRDAIGRMSCNPAIGGVAKGQLVREIDALGGAMGLLIDRTGIQFRVLNRSKGAAVMSPRAQADKAAYQHEAQALCESAESLTVLEGEVVDLLVEQGEKPRVTGVELADGTRLTAPRVVLTTGTFLGGLLHYGQERIAGGRAGEPACEKLSRRLAALGFRLGRLKTGTPPRLDGRTIRWSELDEQKGDDPPEPFSFLTDRIGQEQRSCFITRTTQHTHEIIRENLSRSPLYSGQIQGVGPRYCPSIEDKIRRFAERESHQIFLEPEGLDTDEIYPNGISTSMPRDVQDRLVASVPGLEQARILRYGYAVEYDFVPPTQLWPWLETRAVQGLFLAGQINGTTGYEEAAAQGLMAGLNAALALTGCEPLVLRRDQAYIGVLIDDLTTRGAEEPYRMFTSLAEYRLRLRSDNADQRLTPLGIELGSVRGERRGRFEEKQAALSAARQALENTRLGGKALWERLRSPEFPWAEAESRCPEVRGLHTQAARALEIEGRYAGYLEKEEAEVKRLQEAESLRIPEDFDYGALPSLRGEAREKLQRVRPRTLGQASRIPGLGQADMAVLRLRLRSRR